MGQALLSNTDVWLVNWVKKDIKRLWIEEQLFLSYLKDASGHDFENLDSIPAEFIPDLSEVTRSLVLHIITLNTIINNVWEKNINSDFSFQAEYTSDFVRRIAYESNITIPDILNYMKDKKTYIDSLLATKH